MNIIDKLKSIKNQIDEVITEIEKQELIERIDVAQETVPEKEIK